MMPTTEMRELARLSASWRWGQKFYVLIYAWGIIWRAAIGLATLIALYGAYRGARYVWGLDYHWFTISAVAVAALILFSVIRRGIRSRRGY